MLLYESIITFLSVEMESVTWSVVERAQNDVNCALLIKGRVSWRNMSWGFHNSSDGSCCCLGRVSGDRNMPSME
jgi:hypothetical protein